MSKPGAKQRDGGNFRLWPGNNHESLAWMRLNGLTLCGLCEDFSFFGSLETGRTLALEHRTEHHPRAVDRGQPARQKAVRQSLPKKWFE